jgi:glycosyltransferase involved in cell wall biosynthesis
MTTSFKGAVVVVPTRNRGHLAVNAIRSVLEQPDCAVKVLVSDNSTSEEERAELESFCAGCADPRLRYIRSPASLSMAAHWNWAAEQALARYDLDHFIYLTDRMAFKPRALRQILTLAARHPASLVSYHHDRIVDHEWPVHVDQYAWTGKPLLIDSQHLLRLYSKSFLHPCLPRMLNSVAPRSALRVVRDRFGSIFGSLSPDYNFGFRCLAVSDSLIYYDASPIFGCALDRSTGMSASRGVDTRDLADFNAHIAGGAPVFHGTPAPEVVTVGNAIFYEYCVVGQQAGGGRFPPIEEDAYFQYIAVEVAAIEDPAKRSSMYEALEARGWHGARAAKPAPQRHRAPRLRNVRTRLIWELKANRFKPLWCLLWRTTAVGPHEAQRFEFRDRDEAISFISSFPRARMPKWRWQVELLDARELPEPDAP